MTDIFYKINPNGVASENFGDETVVIYIPRGRYYSLRDSAMLIWEMMAQPTTAQHLKDVLKNKYEITNDTVLEDVALFISQLLNEGLIIEMNENNDSLASLPLVSKQQYIKPVFEIFTDMENLLLLDPIHDASSTKGWPHKNV